MRKSVKIAGILAGALAFTAMFGVSAFADSRHRDESSRHQEDRYDRYDRDERWRQDRDERRRDDRDFLTGVVERVDRRRGVVVLRTRNSGRPVLVQMTRRAGQRRLGLDDLRRGDRATFIGDWSRNGVFTSWRIDDVDSRRGHGRGRGRW